MNRRSPQAIWPASSGGYPATLLASELKLGVRAIPARMKGRTFKGAGGTGNGGTRPPWSGLVILGVRRICHCSDSDSGPTGPGGGPSAPTGTVAHTRARARIHAPGARAHTRTHSVVGTTKYSKLPHY